MQNNARWHALRYTFKLHGHSSTLWCFCSSIAGRRRAAAAAAAPQPLPLLVLGKVRAHWLTSGVPLVLVSPLLAITYQMPPDVIGVLMLSLFLGTIILSLLGGIGAALTVGLHRGSALLSLLVLPLAMPVLILGPSSVSLAAGNELYTPGLWALAAYAVGALSLAPFAAAAALRITNE